MSDQEICDLFDTNWSMTLQELSQITGKTIDQLRTILMH